MGYYYTFHILVYQFCLIGWPIILIVLLIRHVMGHRVGVWMTRALGITSGVLFATLLLTNYQLVYWYDIPDDVAFFAGVKTSFPLACYGLFVWFRSLIPK